MTGLKPSGLVLATIGIIAAFDLFDADNFIDFDEMTVEDIPEEFFDGEAGCKFLVEHPSTPYGDMLGLNTKDDEIINIAVETEDFDATFKGIDENPLWKRTEEDIVKRSGCGCPASKKRQIAKRSGTPLRSDKDKGKWTDHTVLWYLKSSGSDTTAFKVASALEKFKARIGFCIDFKQLKEEPTDPAVNYVVIENGGNGRCNSYVGMVGNGAQSMSLGQGCGSEVVIQHEFMHALGFLHEHMRPDRNNAVKINFANINSTQCRNFNMCKECETYAPYNSKSIMQYPSWAFGCDGKDTVVNKDGSKIEYNYVIQDSDVTAIRDLYRCVSEQIISFEK